MALEKIASMLMFILGIAFNLALLVIVVYAVILSYREGLVVGAYFAEAMVATGPDEEVIFILDEDTPASEVARRLEEQGIIQNRWVFQLELFLKNSSRVYRAGEYRLNRSMSNMDVNVALRAQPTATQPYLVVRVVEGWTMQAMAEYFEYREFFTAEEFFYVAEHGHFSFPFLLDVPQRENRLEGYLFPETYHVSLRPTPGELITIMLRQFDRVFNESMHNRAEELGLTVDEVVIMASIVEAETRIASERPIIAQIIHSRLARGMNLNMDSTVAYAVGVRRDLLEQADFRYDSPFNTFRRSGLPPAPITNPSEASIRAVLYPAETNYLFFAIQDAQTGRHRFFATQAEYDGRS